MHNIDVDRALGQTPCLCGDVETWHPECFSGKTPEEIKAGYVNAYRKARRILKARASAMVMSVLQGEKNP